MKEKCNQLHFITLGAGEPVIVVNGGPGLTYSYLFSGMRFLEQTRETVLYDQRGAGHSVDTLSSADELNFPQFVEDLEQLRNSLGYTSFTLIGHSWGGMLATRYAIEHPERLSHLIIMNSMPLTSSGIHAFLRRWQAKVANSEEIADLQESKAFLSGDVETVKEVYRLIFRHYVSLEESADLLDLSFPSEKAASNSFMICQAFLRFLTEHEVDLRPELAKLGMPALIIHGEEDIVPVWTAEEIAEAIPDSRLVVLEKCGHFPYVEQAEAFQKAIRLFLPGSARIGS